MSPATRLATEVYSSGVTGLDKGITSLNLGALVVCECVLYKTAAHPITSSTNNSAG